MDYSSYSYHNSKHVTRPRSCDYNIKGLELEISDSNASDILDYLIANNIIISPENECEDHRCNVAIEHDGSDRKSVV